MDHNKYMHVAISLALESDDPSVQNGAVVIDPEGKVVGSGWNGFPRHVKETDERWERPQKYMWVEHAERNAIYNAAWYGDKTADAIMYCPWAACADCARGIVQSGITTLCRLPMGEHEGWVESIIIGDTILREAGVEIVELPLEEFSIPKGLRLGQFR